MLLYIVTTFIFIITFIVLGGLFVIALANKQVKSDNLYLAYACSFYILIYLNVLVPIMEA